MYPLFETLLIKDKQVQHVEWHEERYRWSYEAYYNKRAEESLMAGVSIDVACKHSLYRLKIAYSDEGKQVTVLPYTPVVTQFLQVVQGDGIDYRMKFSHRACLQRLFAMRGKADDVLIVQNGLITDTSVGNILFYKQGQWFTPAVPLLRGTCRARLLASGVVVTSAITIQTMWEFEAFQVVNALRGFDEACRIPMQHIRL